MDVGINVSLSDIILDEKPEKQEKSIMTDEFYNLKDNLYPLYCSKCTTHIHSAPIEQICQIMGTCLDLNDPIFIPRAISPLSVLSGK